MAELKVKIEPEDIVDRALDETVYKGRTLREWADALTQPKTNADRIRAMSDEELAKYLNIVETIGSRLPAWGRTAWLDWLKSEAKEKDDGRKDI